MVLFCLTAAGVLALDLITKYLVTSGMELYSSITLIPGVFNLTYIENEGAAWGLLAGKQFLLSVFTIVVILAIIVYIIKKKDKLPKLEIISLAMITGGGLGNLLGRIFDGKVVDFIELTFSSIFNIFNIADIGITFGCILLIISLFLEKKPADQNGGSEDI